MVNPNGGTKDTNPPALVKSNPQNFSTNFNSKKIELTFDEYINLKDIQKEFIISPSDIEAEVKKDGKKIIINLSKNPSPNTTYILNFGNAITDYTENNINKDYKFIFSTGPAIDSLSLSGNIINAFTKEIQKDILVCLYNQNLNDSVVYKNKPDYTVRSDEKGFFKFTNLKSSDYKIFALKESNSNKLFDSEDEEIAFQDSIINLQTPTQTKDLQLFLSNPKKLKILNKNISLNKIEIIYNKENKLVLLNKPENLDTIIYSTKRDTIRVYYNKSIDSSILYFQNETKIDTIKFKFPKNSKAKELVIQADAKILHNSILIKSTDLINIYKIDSIKLYEDSIPRQFNLKRKSYNSFELNYEFNHEKKYKLDICDSAFVSYQNSKNEKYTTFISFYSEEELGNLSIKNKLEKNVIYELINDKNEVVRKTIINVPGIIEYKNLIPNTYRLRIIEDSNKNGIWDTGNYENKSQPEKINYHVNPIKVRANWDMEIEINP